MEGRFDHDVRSSPDDRNAVNVPSLCERILASTPAMVFVLDKEGRFLSVSRTAAAYFGLLPEDVIKKKWNEFSHGSGATKQIEEHLGHVLATGTTISGKIWSPATDKS